MSATTLAHQGLEAVQNKQYEAAIPLLDKALASSSSPAWLLARGQAHTQLKNYDAALRDVSEAYHVAAERGSGTSRKQMIQAQYRRAVIYFKLGRYADSDCCAKWSMLLAEGRPAREDDGVEKQTDGNGAYTVTYEDGVADRAGQPGQGDADFKQSMLAGIGGGGSGAVTTAKTGFEDDWKRAYTWRSQALMALKNLPEDHEGKKVSVTKIPSRPQKEVAKKPEPEPEVDSDGDVAEPSKPAGPAPGSVPDEKLKLRVDFYQSNQNVTVTLFVKDAKKPDLDVKFSDTQVQISPLPRAAAPYVQPGDREATSTLTLGGQIDPTKSRWSATPHKIELVLQKATPGVKWGSWGKEEIGSAASDAATFTTQTTSTITAQPSTTIKGTSTGPAYPTSSRSGPKNWDKLASGDGTGEGDDADDEKNDVNGFFKQLYKGATPEQQRAMMKSFVESNGTALSTDWNDVKGRTVETVPPEGVEAKKWDAK
ncbi:SGS domain-containing protein [Chaetomium sp. MPI-SDFR-AT-0129]|nr:SGS domain-containing protein [Chaetomium sp. MPI-SDFR-AT-0129]